MARPIAKDHGQKRALILKSAARVFASHGFDRASMNRLAEECGISKATIYHYYDSKDALLFDILDTYLAELHRRTVQADLSGLDPAQQLQHVLTQYLLAYQGMDAEHQLQISGIPVLPPAQQETLRNYQRAMVRHLSDILVQIAPTTFANDRAKLRATAMSAFGMLNWFYMWNGHANAQTRTDYAAHVASLILGGITKI